MPAASARGHIDGGEGAAGQSGSTAGMLTVLLHAPVEIAQDGAQAGKQCWSHDLAEVVTYLRTFLRGLRPPMTSHSNTSSAREIAEGAATGPDASCPTRAD